LAADGPEFETDADVGERHGDQREHEDNEQHVHLVDWPEDGRLPVLETPVTDALDTDLQKDLSAHGSHGRALADLGFLEGVTLGTRASEASEH